MKDVFVNCLTRALYGSNDVGQPGRDVETNQLIDCGLRFFGLTPLNKWASSDNAFLTNQGDPNANFGNTVNAESGYGSFSATSDVPLAISGRSERFEVCNINASSIMVNVAIFAWKNGANYETVDLSSELAGVGSQHLLYHDSDTNLFAQKHFNVDWRVTGNSTLNHISLFGLHGTTNTRELVRRVVKYRTVVVPPGGILRFKVFFRRLYPLEVADLSDLRYSWKGLVDKCVYLSWRSMCGVIPTAVGVDPVASAIHTEKPMIAVTRRLSYKARFYYKTYPTRILSTSEVWGPSSVVIPAKTATNRAEKPQRHVTFQGVADPVHT